MFKQKDVSYTDIIMRIDDIVSGKIFTICTYRGSKKINDK